MSNNKIIEGAGAATRRRNPGLYPSECAERSENPAGAKSVKADDVPRKDERALHDAFENWLRVHDRGPIPYVHSRTDRKSTVRVGFPDFGIFYGRAFAKNECRHECCFVEFKMPGEKPTEEQLQYMTELHGAGIPVRVCLSVIEAIEFVREKLGL